MFADILTGDPTRAKQELQKRITKLVLSPKETPNGNVFEVSGDKHAAAAHRSASGPAHLKLFACWRGCCVTIQPKWASFVAVAMLGLASATWAQASADASKAAAAGETSASSAAPVHYYSAQQVDAGFESAAGIGMIYNGDGGTRNFLIMAATRSTPGGGELHMKFTDVIYVVKGSATLITGGQLSGVDENAINPSTGKPFPKDEIRSKSVAGGEPHHLAAGDMIVVPNGVPHQFSRVEGQFRYQLIKIRQP